MSGACGQCLWRLDDQACIRREAFGRDATVASWATANFGLTDTGCPGWMPTGLAPRVDPSRFAAMAAAGRRCFCRVISEAERVTRTTFILDPSVTPSRYQVRVVWEELVDGQWADRGNARQHSVHATLEMIARLKVAGGQLEASRLADSPLTVRGAARAHRLRELAAETCFHPAERAELYVKAEREGWTLVPEAPDLRDVFRGCASAVLQQGLRGEVYCVVVDQNDNCTVGLLWAAGRRSPPQRQQSDEARVVLEGE